MRTPLLLLTALGMGCTAPADEGPWRLVWEDPFDGPAGTAPDPEHWILETGRGPNGDGWGNQELQHYTDRADNVDLDGNGFLRIRARRESYEGADFTSGRIKTQSLAAFTYGRIEARVTVPEGQGLWPAFWMLGEDIVDVGWPLCGEIDILEVRGHTPDTIFGTLHGPGYSGGDSVGNTYTLPDDASLAEGFHDVAIEWDPGHIAWSVDGEVFHTATAADLPDGAAWVFDHDFFLLFNLAVGGTFLGAEQPDGSTPEVATYGIDHVRVYERVEPLSAESLP